MNQIVPFIFGSTMLAAGVILPLRRLKRRIFCSEKVKATVVRLESKSYEYRGRTRHNYWPIFSYTVDGKEYTTRSDVDIWNVLKYKKGNEVTIRYNPEYPDKICVGVKVSVYVYGLLLVATGVSCIVAFADIL